ncbi:MAG: hypothetical protein RL095_506 [Verrucomicrobiota bacterium]
MNPSNSSLRRFGKLSAQSLLPLAAFTVLLSIDSKWTSFLVTRIAECSVTKARMAAYGIGCAAALPLLEWALCRWLLPRRHGANLVFAFWTILLLILLGPVALILAGIVAASISLHHREGPRPLLHGGLFVGVAAALIIGLMSACLAADGYIRRDFLFAYKKMNIAKGTVYWRDTWGWVDRTHYRPDQFDEVRQAMEAAGPGKTVCVTLHEGWKAPLGFRVVFSPAYEIEVPASPEERWAVITGILLHAMEVSEGMQGASPWYHGNQLSAFQFEDIASSLRCCLDQLPNETRTKDWTGNNLPRWEEEGRRLVVLRIDSKQVWGGDPASVYPMADPSKKISLVELRKRVESANAFWKYLGDQDVKH